MHESVVGVFDRVVLEQLEDGLQRVGALLVERLETIENLLIETGVHECVQQPLVVGAQLESILPHVHPILVRVVTAHDARPSRTIVAFQAFANAATAVCRRLLTVPSGISSVSAIWL